MLLLRLYGCEKDTFSLVFMACFHFFESRISQVEDLDATCFGSEDVSCYV